jgi:hypothetical protein
VPQRAITFESIMQLIDSTEKQHAKYIAEADAQRKKDAAEADAQRKKDAAEAKVRLKKLEELIGGISNNNGFLAEEYFYNALASSLRFGKVKYNSISKNINRKQGKLEDEYDIVMFNGSSVAIIETKYRAHQNSLKHLTTKKVQNFRTLYPEFATHKIYLGIASMSFNDAVVNEAKELGIGILKQKGDTIECDAENIKAY